MRSYLAEFSVISPRSLDEALWALKQRPAPAPIAGGTDLMVLLNAGQLPPGAYLNLHSIPELRRPIEFVNGEACFGALTTYADARRHPEIRKRLPMLCLAAREIGALQIQSRGTWAGNIVNASPAADGVPALMAYDAAVELSSASGVRSVALADFYSGYKQTARRPDELVTAIRIPVPEKEAVQYYRKVGTRKFQAISKVLLAGIMVLGKDRRIKKIRLVYASVMPYTYRARAVEAVLEGRVPDGAAIKAAVAALRSELKPIDDVRSTAAYRLRVACNLLEEFLSASSPSRGEARRG
ncbi:xanthine dehydrogenase family protein subunit M [bacterium]|nr:xanthine dehydrogenase family protein subunit M [bacterium]